MRQPEVYFALSMCRTCVDTVAVLFLGKIFEICPCRLLPNVMTTLNQACSSELPPDIRVLSDFLPQVLKRQPCLAVTNFQIFLAGFRSDFSIYIRARSLLQLTPGIHFAAAIKIFLNPVNSLATDQMTKISVPKDS